MSPAFHIRTPDNDEFVVSKAAAEYIATLDHEDIDKLKSTIEFVQLIRTGSSVIRWFFVGIISCVAAVVSIYASIKTIVTPSH